MMKAGRNIHHHEFFQVHLVLYALRAMGPPKLRDGDHEFLLMVVIELVSISPPPPDPGKPQKRIAVTNILPVPLCIVPPEIVDLHRAVVAGKGAGEYLHSIWITKSGVYRLEEDTSRIGVLAIQPLLLQSMGNPMFTLDLYSHSYGLYRRVNFDLDFLFMYVSPLRVASRLTKIQEHQRRAKARYRESLLAAGLKICVYSESVLYLLDLSFYSNIDSATWQLTAV
jgi:hypothetical protein